MRARCIIQIAYSWCYLLTAYSCKLPRRPSPSTSVNKGIKKTREGNPRPLYVPLQQLALLLARFPIAAYSYHEDLLHKRKCVHNVVVQPYCKPL